MKKLWSLLNGKKTFIGAVLFTVYTLGIQHGVWADNGTIEFVLQLVFGLGVAHKAAKYVKETA